MSWSFALSCAASAAALVKYMFAVALSPASLMHCVSPMPSGPRYGMSVVKMLFIWARGMQPFVAEVAPA